MKKKKIIYYVILLFVILNCILTTCCYAINTGDFTGIYSGTTESTILTAGGAILGAVQVIAVGFALVSALIMGMKYMFSSVEDKATIKQKMILFIGGAVIVFGATGLIKLIAKWANAVIK